MVKGKQATPLSGHQRRQQRRQQRRTARHANWQARQATLKKLSAQQAPLQLLDHLLIPVSVSFLLIVVSLVIWWVSH